MKSKTKEQKEKELSAKSKFDSNVIEPLKDELWKLIGIIEEANYPEADILKDVVRAGKIAEAILNCEGAIQIIKSLSL